MVAFSESLLSGKRILITGGGTGLGKSLGRRFLSLGGELVICGRRSHVLEATAAEFMQEFGTKIATYMCDIRNAESVEQMMDDIWVKRPIDVLVNNAAGNFIAQTHKLSPRAIDAVLNVCLHGAAYCTVAAGRRWIEAGRPGTVLSVLTLSALLGAPFTVPSAMAKAGLDAMTKSLAVEWGPKGIRLVAVAPGSFPTPTATLQLSAGAEIFDPGLGVPLLRGGEHAELANLCAFLASDMAGYINGETVVIDGGQRYLGGARATSGAMLKWTERDWDQQRENSRGATSNPAR